MLQSAFMSQPSLGAPKQPELPEKERESLSCMRIINARQSEGISGTFVTHTCRRDVCNPRCEQDLIDNAILPPTSKPIHPHVYVCKLRGVHVCGPDKCQAYIGTHDGVCPVSGVYLGHTEGERGSYVPQERRTAKWKRTGGVKGMIGKLARELTAEQEERAQRAAQKRLRETEEAQKTFEEKRQRGAFGKVFKKEPVDEEDGGNAIVKVEPGAPQQPQKKRGRANFYGSANKRRNFREEAENIICHLLYSKIRKKLNAEKDQKRKAKRNQTISQYYADRAGVTFPIMVEVEGHRIKYDLHPPHLKIIKRDDALVAHYVDMVMHVWNIVTQSPWGLKTPNYVFEAHTLATLYLMRHNLVIGGVVYLPADPYLFNLPANIDLPLFATGSRKNVFESATITSGKQNIRNAYLSAIGAGWPVRDLMYRPDRTLLKTEDRGPIIEEVQDDAEDDDLARELEGILEDENGDDNEEESE